MKKGRLILIVILLLSVLTAFYLIFLNKGKGHSSGTSLKSLSLEVKDSIPLFNDSLSFSFVNLQKCDADSILTFQYPILNLSLLNGKGNFIREVTRRGELKEQFTSAFINTSWGPDGRLYVVEEGNAPRLRIFDKNLNYITNINLIEKLGNHYIPSFSSSFYVETPEDTVYDMILYTTVGNVLYHTSSKKLYESDTSVASMYIKNNRVVKVNLHVPLAGFSAVQSGLEKDKKNWDSPTPIMKFSNGLFYLKYEFDDSVYVFDRSWNKVKAYGIKASPEDRGFSIKFEPIMDLTKSVESDFKIRYLNRYYYSMEIYSDYIYLFYYKPSKPSVIPRNLPDEQKFMPEMILHRYNMKTGEEAACALPAYVSPYSKLYINKNGEIYFLGNNKIKEDVYVYKFKTE